jgi:hypothetical protein
MPALPEEQGHRLHFGKQPAQPSPIAALAEIGAQAGEPFARPCQVVGERGMQTSQIANTPCAVDPCAAPGALPVEQTHFAVRLAN